MNSNINSSDSISDISNLNKSNKAQNSAKSSNNLDKFDQLEFEQFEQIGQTENRKSTSLSEESHTIEYKRKKQEDLVESNKIAIWTQHIIKDMDKFASAQSTIVFTVMAYFLGHNLNNFLFLFIIFTIYILIQRVIRWWVQGWLFYLLEFCYFGLVGHVIFLIFFPSNKIAWSIIYVCNTGNMAISIILFGKQASFNSCDHICSAWLHVMPLISSCAIRWRQYIYPLSILKSLTFKFVSIKKMEIFTLEDKFNYLVVYPFCFWLLWVVYYIIVFYFIFRRYINSYQTGLDDFKKMGKLAEFICGKPEKYTKVKYLLEHFLIFCLGLPIAYICYYSFIINVCWIIILLWILIWNAGKRQASYVERRVNEIIKEELKHRELKEH